MGNNENWSGRNPRKDELRQRVWSSLVSQGAAKENPFQSIPDFEGSDRAAKLLTTIPEWHTSKVMMCSPDVPQIPVRFHALQDGMTVYMAVPKLLDERCFVALDKEMIYEQGGTLAEAATWQGALKLGRYIHFEEMKPVDISVTGCVAVTKSGGRTGKGGGFADLEYALMRRYKKISDVTPIITTVHPLMIVDESDLPLQDHDTYLTMIVTPEEIIRIQIDRPQPQIDWKQVQPDQLASIPILRRLMKEDNFSQEIK